MAYSSALSASRRGKSAKELCGRGMRGVRVGCILDGQTHTEMNVLEASAPRREEEKGHRSYGPGNIRTAEYGRRRDSGVAGVAGFGARVKRPGSSAGNSGTVAGARHGERD